MKIASVDWNDPADKTLSKNCFYQDLFLQSGSNTGNLVHLDSYDNFLLNHSINRLSLNDTENINQNDLMLLKCANQVGCHQKIVESFIKSIEEIKIPIIACCLGAQNKDINKINFLNPNDSTIEFFKILSKKRYNKNFPNISVRGNYTKEVLKNHEIESFVTGCASSLMNKSEKLGDKLAEKYLGRKIKNICYASGDLNHFLVAKLEYKFLKLMKDYNGIYISQSPGILIDLIFGKNVEVPDIFEHIYKMKKEDLRRWFITYGKAFFNLEDWSNALGLYDMIIGPRYHGVLLGVQNEILGTVLAIDSRTEELCITNGIKYLCLKDLFDKEIEEIIEISIWKENDFNRLNKQINYCRSQFNEFFTKNGVLT